MPRPARRRPTPRTYALLCTLASAGCGGRETPAPTPDAGTPNAGTEAGTPEAGTPGAAAAAPAPAPPASHEAPPPASGATHDVRMVGDARGYRFEPARLTINTGDAVRWTNVSGGPHNVAFWADSLPVGTLERLGAQMPNTTSPLNGPLLVDANATYTVPFTGLRPGVYRYYCTPHLALGMTATITVVK